MAFDGAGNFARLYSWITDAANAVPITASRMDAEDNGFATGLSNCITRDGQGKPLSTINWNNQQITNINYAWLNSAPTQPTHAANKLYVDSTVQASAGNWAGTASGTANAIAVTLTPAPTALSGGLEVAFIAAANNTGAATLTVNALAAAPLVRQDNAALRLNDVQAGELCVARYDTVASNFKLTSLALSQVAPLFMSGTASTGSANAQIVAAPSFTLTPGYTIVFNPGFANSGALQINVNGTGLVNVYTQSSAGPKACVGGELVAGQFAVCVYDGTQFELINSALPAFNLFSNLASAATTDLGTVPSRDVNITGTTTITAFGSSANLTAPLYFLTFAGALTLTYNATSLILPGAANITTAAGDTAIAQYLGSGNWRVLTYQTASAQPIVPVAAAGLVTGKMLVTSGTFSAVASLDITVPSDAQEVEVELSNVTCTATSGTVSVQYKVGGTLVTTGYYLSMVHTTGSTVTSAGGVNGASFGLTNLVASITAAAGTLKLTGVQSGSSKFMSASFTYIWTANWATFSNGLNAANTGLVSDILIAPPSGTFSGAYRVYKIK